MGYELTDEEKKLIDAKAAAFWADMRVMVHLNAVILYVRSSRDSFDYPVCLGIYDHPQEVLAAILEYPGYANRSHVSAANMEPGGVATFKAHGLYADRTPGEIAALCESAIEYWRKQQVSP